MSYIENPKFKGMLSLAKKANKLEIGEARAESAIRGNMAYIIILSDDASDNTKKKFEDMGKFRGISVIYAGEREKLGASVGKKFAVSMAVCDKGFADAINKICSIPQ